MTEVHVAICKLVSRESKTNYFPREQTLNVLLYSEEINIKKIFIQQLYFVIKTIQSKRSPIITDNHR